MKRKYEITIYAIVLILLFAGLYKGLSLGGGLGSPAPHNSNHNITNNRQKLLIDKNITGNTGNFTFTMPKNVSEVNATVYSNNTMGILKFRDDLGHTEMSIPLHGGNDSIAGAVSYADPPHVILESGQWSAHYNLTGNDRIHLFIYYKE